MLWKYTKNVADKNIKMEAHFFIFQQESKQ